MGQEISILCSFCRKQLFSFLLWGSRIFFYDIDKKLNLISSVNIGRNDTLKALDDFKNKQQLYMKKWFLTCKSIYILKACSVNLGLDKTQALKKFPLDKINMTENLHFFNSQAPTHHTFTFYF